MKTVIIITVEKEDHADAINENLAELERDGTLDFAFNVEIKNVLGDSPHFLNCKLSFSFTSISLAKKSDL